MAYRILTWFLRIVTRVFFRQVEVAGIENIPGTGPVLFAGNHPNSLIDPILIITTCQRKAHFAAKDSLFKGRIMGMLLRGLGAVPLARKIEHDGKPTDAPAGAPRDSAEMGKVNDAAFEHMFGVLADGGAIGIFPEGISHDESHLAKLKTGAARLALGGAARTGAPIAIVPCGLTFIHPKRFRSRVLVQYGPPIEIAASTARDAVKAATAEIENGLRRLTINAPDWETVRALDTVRRLYQPQEISIEDRIELSRRFNMYYGAVAADPKVLALMTRVRAYQEKLDELGITDRELARDLSKLEVSARMMRHLVLVAFWLPLCVPGAPLHLPTVLFARIAGPRLTPRKDVIATTKMLVGMLLVLLSYAIAVGVVWWKAGPAWAALAATILPLSGWATLRVLDRLRLVRRAFGVLARRLRFRSEVQALRAERARLADDVIRTVGEIKPPELEALFPPGHPDRFDPAQPFPGFQPAETSQAQNDADLDAELDKDAAEDAAEEANEADRR
ncbi:MAG: 1-acyl-sn-glycerol-3-phosphate acyltransferase [Deltaproteobacteria bacterium]|nr:1-acyl-sn-glycerol-3-phosphate acyltransferase [Deltaproteobacteria bacterium]MDQ3299370.1 lysophospholipid acyltransferase family protein [Myxococcota bacterium]